MSTYQVDASFSVEVTVPGPVAYSSQKSRAAFTLGETVEADSPEEARDIALQRANQIAEDAKISVAANTPGISIGTDEHGVAQLVFQDGGEVQASEPTATVNGNGNSQPSTTQSSEDYDIDELPVHISGDKYLVEWNGEAVTLFDNRETKQGNQPDFKLVYEDGEDDPFWLELKSGGKNRAALALAAMVREATGG